jgi:Fur family transcriptional regulator, ferric uptake regulator
VTAADIGGGQIVYEASSLVPHHHLVCRTCGKIIQISHREVEGFYKQIYDQHAYRIDMNHLTLFGLCPDCQS